MFNEIAKNYDRTNKILSLGLDGRWRRRAVKRLDPQPNRVYLDAGCGTGDVSILIAKRSRRCRVVGIDPSEGMLRIGMSKIEKAGLSEKISMKTGDILNLDFPDRNFDGAITAFCIRNVTDRKQALAELLRVIRPGGQLVILELTEPAGIMKHLFKFYSRVAMPVVTALMSSAPAYRYLSDSMTDFPKPEAWLGLMEDCGFVNTETESLTGGIARIFSGRVPS